MLNNALLDPLLELDSYNKVLDLLKDKSVPKTSLCTGVIDSQKCHLAAALSKHSQRPLLLITHSELKAKEIYEDMRFFMDQQVYLYPVRDLVFYSADVKSSDLLKARFDGVNALLCGKKPTIVCSVEALFDRLTPKNIFQSFMMRYQVGDVLNLEELAKRLMTMGYERAEMVEGMGQFAIRGGILDVFGTNYDNPLRIELWGDEIDSIRMVDVLTQRSIEKINEACIFPMRELLYNEEQLAFAIQEIEKQWHATQALYQKKL